jgi:hypothetical protein
MKEQGLQHNFQQNIHSMLLETKIVGFKPTNKVPFFDNAGIGGKDFKKYYFKSHELLMMLENSSQAENAGSGHLRNTEIIRVRGFSQSLIQKILLMN